MKMSKTFLIPLLLLILAIGTFPTLAFANTSNEEYIEVHQVIQNGPNILIELDYDLSSTSLLDTNESLAVLVIFSDSTNEDTLTIQAAMLFFHTDDNQFLLFWMLGDPFKQAQNWQEGTENEHFQTDGDQLTLTFIEFVGAQEPEITVSVYARITSSEINAYTTDFRIVLDQFIEELTTQTTSEETSGPLTTGKTTSSTTGTGKTERTTSTKESSQTKTDIASGFTILSIFGILLSVVIIKRFTRKN
ncbi:MAG: hypothetical protein ACFFB5_09685 [Promethearchaeota archaeon]